MDKEKIDELIEHAGVKGMRWGVRRKRDSSGSASKGKSSGETAAKVKGKSSDDAKKVKALRKKKLKELSDSEIAAVTKRLQLEKQYKDLTSAKVSPGKQFLREQSKALLSKTANQLTDKAAQAIVSSMLDTAKKKAGGG